MEVDNPHAQMRMVHKLGVRTPLIVPSFSSRGFPHVADIWDEFSHKLYGVCLVSAFDVAAGRIPSDVTDSVNVVILDSGLYEVDDRMVGSCDQYAPSMPVTWTRHQYHETLNVIGQTAKVILVNFDQIASLEDQLCWASEDFRIVPHVASDFLIKPTGPTEFVNLPKLRQRLDELAHVSVIGITAREAGDSLLTRCNSIVMLRDMLNDAGLDTPIHVFGAITPYELLTYFFCGADIFDGLDWLRFLFRKHGSTSIDESAMETLQWNLTDLELQIQGWTRNLRFLYQLQEAMQRFGTNCNLETLVGEFPIAKRAAEIAYIAGAEINE